MQQKLVNGHLYVFDLTPFEITENTDASVIFVQNECLEGYKELNVSLAAKIQGFNQFLLCVQKQEWSMPADPVDGGLEWSASTATVRIGDTNSYPTLINPNELEVTYSSSNESVATIDSTGAITLVGAGSTNITVESAAEPGFTADSASYALTVLAAQQVTTYALTINTQNFTGDEALYVEGVNNPQFDTEMYVPEGTHAHIYVNNPENYVTESDAVVTAGEGPYTYNGQTYDDYILVFGWAEGPIDPVTNEPSYIEGTMPAEDHTETFIYQAPGYTFTITGQYITAACDVYFDDVQQDWNESDNGSWSDVPAGTTIGIIPYYDSSDYTTDLPMQESGEYSWVVTMPDEDLTITIDYNSGSGESGESGAS